MRNEDDGEGDDDDVAAAEARSHVFERNYRGLGKESSASHNSAHLRYNNTKTPNRYLTDFCTVIGGPTTNSVVYLKSLLTLYVLEIASSLRSVRVGEMSL